jgi:hypothetical protein
MKLSMPARVAISTGTVLFLSLAGGASVLAAPPSNDDFNAATVISAFPFADTVNTTEATAAPDDPVPSGSCALGDAVATVWYSLTPASDMRIRIDTSGSDYFAVVAAYTGSRGALAEIGCGGGSNLLTLDVAAGVMYSFMVFPLPGTLPGTLSFSAQEIVPVSAAVTINPTGLVNPKTGVATVSGTITCSGLEAMTLDGMPGPGTLQQVFAHRVIISGTFNPPVTACTGAAIGWSSTLTGTNGLFGPGSAQAFATIQACSSITFECAIASTNAAIRLKASRS